MLKLALLALSAFGALQPAGSSPLERYEASEPHMGTMFRMVLYAPDVHSAQSASQAAFARIEDLDRIMSDYNPVSELMRLCEAPANSAVPVSENLFRVLARAVDIARETDGAFDPTVGPMVRLWRRARRQHALPEATDLNRARALVGYQLIELNPSARTVRLPKAGMRLDLGGIGKGFAADEALAVLRSRGISAALVAAGGDIALGDAPPGENGWEIEVAPLDPPPQQATRSSLQSPHLRLHNAGISTSGDAEQHVEINGVRYSHIVDPRSGSALTGRISVTVVAPDDTTADALATAFCVLGPIPSVKKVKEELPDVGVFIVQSGPEGVQSFQARFP